MGKPVKAESGLIKILAHFIVAFQTQVLQTKGNKGIFPFCRPSTPLCIHAGFVFHHSLEALPSRTTRHLR